MVARAVAGSERPTSAEVLAQVKASGVKVRPNGFTEGVDRQRTIEQIGRALRECGEFAADYGQLTLGELLSRFGQTGGRAN